MNVTEIEIQLNDLVNEDFDPTSFPFRFIECFDAPKATVTKLRQGTMNKAKTDGEVLWSKKLYYRISAKGAAATTLDAMAADSVVKANTPRFLLTTDGVEFSALDIKADETRHGEFSELNEQFDLFLPLAGVERYEAIAENPADIKAAGRLARFYDAILAANPDWSDPEHTHNLNLFMTRVLFCMFAEDTGIFENNLFTSSLNDYTNVDGSDVAPFLRNVFAIMDTDPSARNDVPDYITRFPYVNGGLFQDKTEIPTFSKLARRILLEAARLDWGKINPDIFGSMIQAVVEPGMRGDLGMHYTSVPNIMKVLQPLFLLNMEEQFEEGRDNIKKLEKLLTRISKIRVFDPACGSGNFLIIAYRELRTLEMRVLTRLNEIRKHLELPFSQIKLNQFYGIEYADFACETAKLSLWIAEYQMNQQFKDLFGEAPPALPLKESGNIIHGNALRLDWLDVCPLPVKRVHKEKIFDLVTVVPINAIVEVIDEEVETYIVGNPPYLGSRNQTSEQKEDIKLVCSKTFQSYKTLDYVACWYIKGAEYCEARTALCAFVSTNSICQGSQVPLLWPPIFERGLEIGFAHQSFKWKNNAAKNAGVTCVIVGIRATSKIPKKIYNGDYGRIVKNISPYLLEMNNDYVVKKSVPISNIMQMTYGNYPGDGNQLTLSPIEKNELVSKYPEARNLVRRLYGAQEFLKGIERWCLWIEDKNLSTAQSIPFIAERIEATKSVRLASKDAGYQKLAMRPHQYRDTNVHVDHTIIVPTISSERRNILPVGIISDGAITTNQVFALHDAPMEYLSVLSSRLHYVWMASVCGRLKTDYRYSSTMCYNTFPLPLLTEEETESLENGAWRILEAREAHPGKTIAWLYHPDTMPTNLLSAHQALDNTLERIYIGRPFKNDTERLEHLFKLYAKMTKQEGK